VWLSVNKKKHYKKIITKIIKNTKYTFLQLAKTDQLSRAYWVCPELGAQCQTFRDLKSAKAITKM
jgi:hypothetical protein